MVERAVEWLHTGGRILLRNPKKPLHSRRHLHSAFWSHGAGNIDLPPWWMLFLQNIDSTQHSCANRKHRGAKAALSNGLQEVFLDFLYPVHTLALIRRLKESANAQRHAAQNIRHCSRSYTSIATSFLRMGKAFGTATGRQAQDTSTSSSPETPQPGDAIRRGISEILDSDDPRCSYDELWQSYQDILQMSQSLSPQELIKMLRRLGQSQKTVDLERAVALFDSIPVQERRAIHYSYAVSAALSLNDPDTAADIHREALVRINGAIGTAALLRYTVQHEKWQLAINAWHAYWVDRLHYYTRPDIWTGVNTLSLSDLMEKAISAADFAISAVESAQEANAVAARDFALELTRQIFRVRNTDIDLQKHWRVFQKARSLEASDTTIGTMALEQLLSVNNREHGHRMLLLYRILRKESTFSPSRDLLLSVTGSLLAEKTSLGILMVLEDWHTYHRELPAQIAIEMGRVFAQQGELEQVQKMFHDYGRGNASIDWYHILLFVHNRRADSEGVVRVFAELQKDFDFKPTLRAWNYVIGTFSRIGDIDGALTWFNKLLETELQPSSRTYSLLMSMYAKRGDMEPVQGLYQQAKMDNIEPTMQMVNSLVLAYKNDGGLSEAEKIVKDALHMDLIGSRTHMWNVLLNAYALRREIEKVSNLHKEMRNAGVASDGMTYAALMTSLTVAKWPFAAYRILNRVMPRARIKRTSFHYAIVMGGLLAVDEFNKAFDLYRLMLTRNINPTLSTQKLLIRAAASKDMTIPQDIEQHIKTQTEFVRARQAFEQTISGLDPTELAPSEPRNFVGPDLLDEAFSSTPFDYLIFLYGKHAAYEYVTELYERYLSTSAQFNNRDVELSPPIRLLSALMVAQLRAGNHEEVERCWYLALEKSKKLACRAQAVTSEPGWVLYSRRHIMNLPLRQYIRSLSEQGRIDDLMTVIRKLHSSGFALNSANWNYYIQQLAQSPESKYQLLAFELCERELIPNWPGWDVFGNPTFAMKKINRRVRDSLRLPMHPVPGYETLVHLAAVYVQARQGTRLVTPQRLKVAGPKTVDAVISMPRMTEKHQMTLLRGG